MEEETVAKDTGGEWRSVPIQTDDHYAREDARLELRTPRGAWA